MRPAIVLAAVCTLISLRADEPLRVAGSTTVEGLLEPNRTQLESATGKKIEFSGTGSMSGLVSVVVGAADVAMLSLPVEDAVGVVNKKTPGRVDPAQLCTEPIGEIQTLFIVNPHNPVRSLAAAQLADVLTGRITNWKDVGGPDMPIVVVSFGRGGSLLDKLLGGRPIAASARTVSNATQIAVTVAQRPDAIGIISAAHPRGQTTVLQTDAKVIAPLLLVTKGQPTGAVLKFVESARSLLAHASSN